MNENPYQSPNAPVGKGPGFKFPWDKLFYASVGLFACSVAVAVIVPAFLSPRALEPGRPPTIFALVFFSGVSAGILLGLILALVSFIVWRVTRRYDGRGE